MRALLRNRHFLLFVAIAAGAVAALVAEHRPLGDAVGALVILGVLLPLVALAATARMPSPEPQRPGPGRRSPAYFCRRCFSVSRMRRASCCAARESRRVSVRLRASGPPSPT